MSGLTVRTHPGRSLTVAAGGTLLSMVAFTAPLAIVPSVADELRAGTAGTSWILSSMSLGLAVALLSSGAIGDDFGRRRVFVLGAALLALGSVACFVAPTVLTFVAGRVVEGVGAAAVITCGLAAISDTFPAGPERARATGIWGACMGAGPAVGPLLGSAFDVTAGWRWTYLVITLAAGGLAVAGRYQLRESRSGRGRRIDVVGAGLLGVGTGCLLAALTEGRQGWTEPLVIVLAVVAVAGLAGFVLHQRRVADPMLDLSLFRRPALISATLAAFLTGAGIIALMSFMATVLERGMARSSIVASLILLAWSATSVATSLLARRIPLTVSGGVRLSGGLVLVGVGLVPLAALVVDSSVGQMVVGLIVAGVGTGLLNATLGREAVASVPPAKAGAGSGINNASRYIGAAFGVTVVTVIAVHPGADPAHGLVAGWDAAVVVGIVVTIVGAAAVLLLHRADGAFVSRS